MLLETFNEDRTKILYTDTQKNSKTLRLMDRISCLRILMYLDSDKCNKMNIHFLYDQTHVTGYGMEDFKGIRTVVTDFLSSIFFISFMYYVRRKYWNHENFYFRFLMNLHVLGCVKQDFTTYTKCLSLSLSVCGTNVVAALSQKLMDGIL